MPIMLIIIVGFVLYMYASRDSRRDKAVELRLRRMLHAGRDYAIFNDIYFEAARAYAIAKGCSGRDGDAASADVMIDGRAISVTFLRDSGGGTTFMTETVASRDAWLEASIRQEMRLIEPEPEPEPEPDNMPPTREEAIDFMTSMVMEFNVNIILLPDSEYAQLFRRMEVPIILSKNISEGEMAQYIQRLMIYVAINARLVATWVVDEIIGDAGADFKGSAEGADFVLVMLLRGLEMISLGIGEGSAHRSDFNWIDFRSLPGRVQSVASKFNGPKANARRA